jgi:putative acetyltransferase
MEIEVRHAEPEDYQAIHELHCQPQAIWGTLQLPFPSLEMWRKRLAEKPDALQTLVACVEGDVVGCLGLKLNPLVSRRRHAASLGMAVHDRWQGRGVGTRLMLAATDLADKWLDLVRLELKVYVDNERGIRLYQKFGFVIEGTLVKYAFRDGEYVDAYTMARIRSPD